MVTCRTCSFRRTWCVSQQSMCAHVYMCTCVLDIHMHANIIQTHICRHIRIRIHSHRRKHTRASMGALPTMAGSRISAGVQTVSFNNSLVSLLFASMRWLILSVNVLPVPEADGRRGMRQKSRQSKRKTLPSKTPKKRRTYGTCIRIIRRTSVVCM